MEKFENSSMERSGRDRKLRWMRLDNAAKIFPAARRRNWNNVFRLSATLTEPIDPALLQSALDVTIKRFPSIAVRLRAGLFWYYLEEIPEAPKIKQEHSYPLTRMSFTEILSCAFRVLYYKNRIAVEFFHALTDGTGGLVFLKTLVAEYLTQRGVVISDDNGVLNRMEEPTEAELEDSFLRNDSAVSASRREAIAYHFRAHKEPDGFLNLTTGILSVDEVLSLARSRSVSITALLASVLIVSVLMIQDEKIPERKRQKAVKICVPVDLRKIFGSESLRNFVQYVTPGVNPKMGRYTFDEIVKSVHHQMGVEITPKHMAAKVASNVNAEKAFILKIMPLFIKNLAMKLIYNSVGERFSSLTLSNLGMVTLPENMSEHVTRLDFVLGVQATYPNNCGVLSYKDKIYINFIRNTKDPALERNFFTYMRKLGCHVTVESNQRD